ncbi:sulfotransferase family protein [Rhodopirellula baltica]
MFWGCDLAAWHKQMRQLRRRSEGFRQSRLIATWTAAFANSAIRLAIDAYPDMRSTGIVVRNDPIFIVGHWRSGTTFLHELLCLCSEVSFLNNYCAFTPHHFLFTEKLLGRQFQEIAPLTRQVDSLPLTWDAPQEDEFALLGMGAPSPYWRFGFPGHSMKPLHEFDYESKDWEPHIQQLVSRLSARSGKRLVLKSPTHSFRVSRLAKLFPKAQFIYVRRDCASAVRSFRAALSSIVRYSSFQQTSIPSLGRLESGYDLLNDAVRSATRELSIGRALHVEFRDLISDPLSTIQSLSLDLGFEWNLQWASRIHRLLDLRNPVFVDPILA